MVGFHRVERALRDRQARRSRLELKARERAEHKGRNSWGTMAMLDTDINDMLKPVLLKDLRTECRARGLNPGGSKDALSQRIKEDMLANGN